MVDLKQRKRKTDIEKMNDKEFDEYMNKMSKRIQEIVDTACKEANSLANAAGIKIEMQFVAKPIVEQNN